MRHFVRDLQGSFDYKLGKENVSYDDSQGVLRKKFFPNHVKTLVVKLKLWRAFMRCIFFRRKLFVCAPLGGTRQRVLQSEEKGKEGLDRSIFCFLGGSLGCDTIADSWLGGKGRRGEATTKGKEESHPRIQVACSCDERKGFFRSQFMA